MDNVFLSNDDVLVCFKPFGTTFAQFVSQNQKNYTKKLSPLYTLDDDCAGVVIFTTDADYQKKLSNEIAAGDFEKHFYVVCVGTPKIESGVYRASVALDSQTKKLSHVPQLNAGAKTFGFTYKVIQKVDKISLYKISGEVTPQEIRFAFADMGAPIFGDKEYGGDSLAKGTFLALMLVDVRFKDPKSKKVLFFRAYPPENKPWSYFDLEKWLRF